MIDRPQEREELYDAIDHERRVQDCKYGTASKTRSEWVMVIGKWFGKLADSADNGNHDEFGRRLLQVAAIAVQAREKGWLEAEEPEEASVPSAMVGELVELAAALEEHPDLRLELEACGIDVGALLGEDEPRPVALTVLDGGKA